MIIPFNQIASPVIILCLIGYTSIFQINMDVKKRASGYIRKRNWSPELEMILMEGVLEREGVLFGRFTGGSGGLGGKNVTVQAREKGWKEVQERLLA